MKKNKNVIALTTLLMFSPLKSNITQEEPTPQQIQNTIIYALNDAQKNFPVHKQVNETERNTEKALIATIIEQKNLNQTLNITLENAGNLLQTNIQEALEVLTPIEIEILTTVISEIVDSAIREIQILKNHEISVQDATKILQDCINNLVKEGKFTLNGITYTIGAPKTTTK